LSQNTAKDGTGRRKIRARHAREMAATPVSARITFRKRLTSIGPC
jgi:hypothetical protein